MLPSEGVVGNYCISFETHEDGIFPAMQGEEAKHFVERNIDIFSDSSFIFVLTWFLLQGFIFLIVPGLISRLCCFGLVKVGRTVSFVSQLVNSVHRRSG